MTYTILIAFPKVEFGAKPLRALPEQQKRNGGSGGLRKRRSKESKEKKTENRARKALKTISLILGAFVTCWTPYHIFAILARSITLPQTLSHKLQRHFYVCGQD